MQKRSQSIILKRTAFGEADWIVTFFSRDEGRMGGIAKSARRSMRRFGGALEPATLVSISYFEKQAGGLVRIDEAVVERSPIGALKSLERIAAMTRALELALAFLQERQPAPDKFTLLDSRLSALSDMEPGISDSLAFELAWLMRCGFGPRLAGCASCGLIPDEGGKWAFDFEQGGVVCSCCPGSPGGRVELTAGAMEALGRLHDGACPEEGGGAMLACRALEGYVDHIIGRRMRTRNF
ncbi:MAG: DNA repair protein RecO [Pseudomonadota bacterium]